MKLNDFQLVNKWVPDTEGPKWDDYGYGLTGQPKYIIDQTTNKKFLNESKKIIRIKCAILTIATPIKKPLFAIPICAFRVIKILSFSHFWQSKYRTTKGQPFREAGKDVLKIAATPLAIIGLECAAIYGVFRPHDGRKIYANIETAVFYPFVLAPCFQPNSSNRRLARKVQREMLVLL